MSYKLAQWVCFQKIKQQNLCKSEGHHFFVLIKENLILKTLHNLIFLNSAHWSISLVEIPNFDRAISVTSDCRRLQRNSIAIT